MSWTVYCRAPPVRRQEKPSVEIKPASPNVRQKRLEDLKCIGCGSDQVQSFRVIHEMGTTRLNGRSSGSTSGLTLGGSGGIGTFFGSTNTRLTGVQQSEAAQLASPPKRRDVDGPSGAIVLGILLIIAGIACGIGVSGGWVLLSLAGVLTVGGGWLVYSSAEKWNREVWPQRHDRWSNSFRCLRRGAAFVHE